MKDYHLVMIGKHGGKGKCRKGNYSESKTRSDNVIMFIVHLNIHYIYIVPIHYLY